MNELNQYTPGTITDMYDKNTMLLFLHKKIFFIFVNVKVVKSEF